MQMHPFLLSLPPLLWHNFTAPSSPKLYPDGKPPSFPPSTQWTHTQLKPLQCDLSCALLQWRPENYPDAEQLYPATEDKPMDFADAVSIEDPELRQRALDELLVPLGHQPGSQVVEIPLHGMRKNDYTPYEYLDWTDDEIAHHLNITVRGV